MLRPGFEPMTGIFCQWHWMKCKNPRLQDRTSSEMQESEVTRPNFLVKCKQFEYHLQRYVVILQEIMPKLQANIFLSDQNYPY